MEVHADHTDQLYLRAPRTTRPSARLTTVEWVATGVGAGLLGGLVMTVPLLLWDWVKSSHIALELPAAATSWLFGLAIGVFYAVLRPPASQAEDS